MRYKITLSYDGSAFCGWQVQPSAPSVQQALEEALSTLLGRRIAVTGAGRTDTGVNAALYVAHFDCDRVIGELPQLVYKLNAILPDQVGVIVIEAVPDGFHARFDAARREYTYFLHRVKDPFVARYSYYYTYPDVDFEAMNRAAQALLGRHDFSCFEKTGADSKTSVCTVFEAGWRPYVPTICRYGAGGVAGVGADRRGPTKEDISGVRVPGSDVPATPPYWYFRIAADRFLRNMVRAVVGTLLEVGRGKRSVESIAELVGAELPDSNTPRRSLAGESVPGHALFLSGIDY